MSNAGDQNKRMTALSRESNATMSDETALELWLLTCEMADHAESVLLSIKSMRGIPDGREIDEAIRIVRALTGPEGERAT